MMGVTLERVQNKFACIIGELCGEPKVLSQFAVWLDLRLAEYKSKGAISLECSGDMPDPSWLEGLKLKQDVQQQTPLYSLGMQRWDSSRETTHMKSTATHTRTNYHTVKNINDPVRSPDVIIKSEPNDQLGSGINPTAVNMHDGVGSHSSDFRKRQSSDGLSGSPRQRLYQDGPSLSKFRRTSAPSVSSVFSQENSSDQSFISPGQMAGDSGSSAGENTDADVAMLISSDMQGHVDEVVREFGEVSGEHSANSSVVDVLKNDSGRMEFDGMVIAVSSLQERLSRGMPTATARRTMSDVNTLENWLKADPFNDRRSIVDISPADLDVYLTEFFSTVRKRDGTDYDHGSLKSLHASFERHLRELGYPCSITKSREFVTSHNAYKTRYNNMRMSCTLTALDLPVLKEKQLLGPYTPESLLNAIFWINSSHFSSALRSKWDQFNLLWGDIELITTESGSQCLVNTGRATRERTQETGKVKPMCRKVRVGPNQLDPDLCPIRIYKLYQARRSAESSLPTTPFYLRTLEPYTDMGPWFRTEALGIKELGTLIRTMKEKAGILGSGLPLS